MENEYWINKIRFEVMPILREKFNPQKVLIFGSRVKGNHNPDSDIDMIIVSELFQDVPIIKRMSLVLKQIRFPKHIDVLCYTPDEFERIQNTSAIIQEALANSLALA
jgi:hypothetical protein